MRAFLIALFGALMSNFTDRVSAAELAGAGISRDLAAARAVQYRDVRYTLALEVEPPYDYLRGRVSIQFDIAKPEGDVILDWRPAPDAAIWNLRVNDKDSETLRRVGDHLIIDLSSLRPGLNVVEVDLRTPIRAAGSGVTRFHDPEDDSDYLYTLFVPADASTTFPCFDQPDIKARFELTLRTPSAWRAIANAPEREKVADGAYAITRFAPTEPISTYLFAFAAGPFVDVADGSEPRLFVRQSRAEHALQEKDHLIGVTRDALGYFEQYFERNYPFAKYDLVLIPEFAYGGMEHAGATFLREESILFPFQPSQADRLRRAQLLLHETAHQWFGDLVTMRWFDDLWLKEGFANFMSAKATAALLPQFDAWNAFRAAKLAAYRTDVTRGTTPIWQPLANLNAAKSAYGNIVYSKAPAVLRQAEFFLGEQTFRRAVVSFVARHAYGAADWPDLLSALEGASGQPLDEWGDTWVRRRGLPVIRLFADRDDKGLITNARLQQQDALGEGGVWPMRTQILLVDAQGRSQTLPLMLRGAETPLPQLVGQNARVIFANAGDYGYGIFLLDPDSRSALLQDIERIPDDLSRALLWDALWESVRAADLPPLDYLPVALRGLPRERDEVTAGTLLARVQTVFRWYLSPAQQNDVAAELEQALRRGMLQSQTAGLRITWFRAYVAMASTPRALITLKQLLAGELAIPDVTLTSHERFRIIRRLLVMADPAAPGLLAEQARLDGSDDGRRQAYAAQAAAADADAKRAFFSAFLNDASLPERWVEEAVGALNAVEHEAITLPLLQEALRALPALKQRHKIFFVNNWLAAFVGGQRSEAALRTVHAALADADLEEDLRRKILEAVDELERTVRIRALHARQA